MSDDYLEGCNFATLAIHAGQNPEKWNCRSVVPPISMSTTFAQKSPGNVYQFEYGRSGNPTRNAFEECAASLEGAKHGLAFSSGLGCTLTIAHLLQAGDEVICIDDCYGGTNRLFNKVFGVGGLKISIVDFTDLSILKAAFNPKVKLVWLETPTNPTLKMVDIEKCSKVAHDYSKDIIVVVDNTFLSPYFQKPLKFGADLVIHSVTKYLNGHSDVVMGVAMTNDDDLARKLRFMQNACGAIPSPFDCYLANRGIKTLNLRMERHFENALYIAKFLEKDSRVEKVQYPALPSYKYYDIYKKQCTGCSGMITFWIKGGLKEAERFLHKSKFFITAESLGGYESLAELPSIMTHSSVPFDQRQVLGIHDNLIRLSVGLEDKDDLLNDIKASLDYAISN